MRIEEKNGELFQITEKFDWISPDEPKQFTFDTSAILQAIELGALNPRRFIVALDKQFARETLPLRGLDVSYAQSLSKTRAAEPVLGVITSMHRDLPTILLIDGTHRYYARYLRNKPDVRYLAFSWQELSPYITEKALELDFWKRANQTGIF